MVRSACCVVLTLLLAWLSLLPGICTLESIVDV